MRERNELVTRPLQQPLTQLDYRGPAAGQGNFVPPLAASLPPETPEPSLVRPIIRQWWLVALCVALFGAAAMVYIKTATPLYTSFTKIYIEPAATTATPYITQGERSNFLPAQLDIIKGSQILNQVADLEGMRQMRTFQPARGNPVLFLREKLSATLERKTDVITISLESPYPQEAQTIVQAVYDAYSTNARLKKDDQNRNLLEVFKKNLADTERERDAALTKMRALREANPTVNPNPNAAGMTDEVLRGLNNRLSQAREELVREQIQFGTEHKTVKNRLAQIEGLQKLYNDSYGKLSTEHNIADELKALQDQYDSKLAYSRSLLESIQKIEGSITADKLVTISVIEPANLPEFPSSPAKKRILSVAIVIGALLGAGLALLRDRVDGRMHSVEEIQGIINMPILGVVPAMSGRRTAIARAMTVHLDPRSVVAEAYRTIRTAVYFGTNNSRCKTILMTSPEPGDGKTTSASNLAIAIAQTGRTVLLLDADFRKPTQHKNLDIKDTVGLSSVLAGRETLERAIQRTGVDGLDILPCGPIPANPSEILNSREFGELIDSLAARYDHIVFDSPPVNAVTDARILGAVVDVTILVVRADKSTKKSGEHARNALVSIGARVLGAIVNDAPNGKGYEAYGSGYYYGSKDSSASAGVIPASRRLTGHEATQKAEEDAQRERENARRRNIA